MTQTSLESELIHSLMKERRRDRRWRNIRFFGYLFIVLLGFTIAFSGKHHNNSVPAGQGYVALVRLDGTIAANKAFSAENVIPELTRAFQDKKAKGVVLLMNSPGGSAVQASIIHDRIEELKKKYHKKVVVVAEDMLASGAYMIASSADKIYVNQDTITGSIGVIMEGFGFTGIMKKLGISRRSFYVGAHKDRMDPFQPVSPADKAKIYQLLKLAHTNFINMVQAGRKGKLHGDPKELFSGDFWDGTTAVKLGLADGVANLWQVMQTQFHVQHYRDYSPAPSLLDHILGKVSTKLNLPNLSFASQNAGISAKWGNV